MAVIIPQVVTEDRASGAQVVDGSLKFDSARSQYLNRTFSSGNQKTFTFSTWVKRASNFASFNAILTTLSADGVGNTGAWIGNTEDAWYYYIGSQDFFSDAVVRDLGWYHVVYRVDTTIASPDADRLRVYVNGNLMSWSSASGTYPTLNYEDLLNSAASHSIGRRDSSDTHHFDGSMTQFYFIDGQSLGPENFGYTDPLTNTWRPKKYEGDFNYVAASGTLLNYDSNTSLPTYSDQDGNSGTPSVYQMENAFDGDSSTYANMTYNNGKWTRANFAQPITNVTRIDIGWDGEGDVGYNGSVVNSSVGYNGSRQSLTLYNNSGSPITLNNIHMVSQAGNGVCRLYDITITTTTQSATELTFTAGTGTNSFYLPMDGNSPIGQDQSGIGNDWTPVNFGGSTALDKATGAFPILNTLGGTIPKSGVLGSGVSESYTILGTSGSGNPYIFEDLGNKPRLSFIRGATYTFDWSAASGHPLRFATAADAAGNTEYTDGTDVTGNVTTITVPHNAPDTLYYYCNVHGGMGNSISVTTDVTKADPYAWKNVIAMPLNSNEDFSGTINCTQTSQTVTNSSTSFNGLSNFYGNTASFSRSSANYLSVPDSAGIELGSDDFTIEFWLYLNNTTNQYEGIISKPGNVDATAAPLIYKETTGNIHINFSTAGSANWNIGQFVGHCSDLAYKWHHIAITRDGSTFRFFLDGVFVKTQTNANALYDNGNPLYIGKYTMFPGSVTYGFDGYLQDFRLYKGVAKYTSTTIGDQAFIPASTNPDILPDTPSGVGTKTQLTKIPSTDSNTLLFPTQGSKIVLGNQYTPIDGTGDYTISFWFFASEYNSQDNNGPDGGFDYILTQAATHPSYPIGITISKAGKIVVQDSGNFGSTWLSTFDYAASYNTNNSIVLGQWSYVHVVRSNGTLYIYNNGNLQYSRSQTSSSPTPTGDITICLNTGSCFVKDFRIEGAAITDPTPPTGSPTATGNTRLLLDGLNDVSGNNVALTVTGDVERDKLSPFITTDINTVRGREGGYATFNSLVLINGGSSVFSEGNLSIRGGSTNGASGSTINPTTGKYYFELDIEYVAGQTQGNMGLGVVNQYLYGVGNPSAASYPSTFCGFFTRTEINSVVDGSETGAQTTEPEINYTLGLTIDYDAKSMTLYLNGIAGNTVSFSSVTNPLLYFNWGNTDNTMVVNFGQKPFKFPPPDGFQPLSSSTVRPDTIISRPDQYFGATLYTGNTDSSQDIDVGFAPDLVWQKIRGQAGDHALTDTVRGISGGYLQTEDTDPQKGNANDGISAFLPNGFRAFNSFNNNGLNWVSWCWKAGGSSNTFNIDDVGYANASDVNMSVGSLNSSLYNQSQTWSTSLTVSGSWDSGGVTPANAFDGLLSTNARSMGQNEQITFDITSTPLNFTDKVELYHTSSGMDVSVNGGTVQVPATNQFVTIASGGGTLNRITFVNANAKTVVTALRVDGKLLVDPNAISTPSIAATGCSVGTKQGFSIVKYTGSGSAGTLAHGLGQKPTFWILKAIDAATYPNWYAYTEQLDGSLDFMHLNTNEHKFDSAAAAPTSTTIGVTSTLSEVGLSWIAYMWHDVPGLQKFGSFTGNSSQNFVELGFRPAMVWVKRAIANSSSDTSTNNSAWTIMDSARLSYNGLTPNHLYANWNVGEGKRGDGSGTSSLGDMTLEPHSNGFYLNGPATETNSNTGQFIYCAWAEAPAFNLYGATSNAR